MRQATSEPQGVIYGTSTDTKPGEDSTTYAVGIGTRYEETDTGKLWKYTGQGPDGWTEDLTLVYALAQAMG